MINARMPEQHPGIRPHAARERRIAAGLVVLLVLLRSAVFVFWEGSYFDSDQAIVGLMAKHLAEGRAFPLFYYGQNYMLGVEAYLAAPVFLVAGVSVTALKLPLLAINLFIALLLLRLFERETGLRPLAAVVPVLFFAIPSPAAAAEILAPNGGNLAPFLYTVVIWLTRQRPNWCGFFVGLGFLHREFTIYALVALLAVEAVEGGLFTRAGGRRRLGTFRTAAEVWLVVQWLKYQSSAAGPGTTMADVFRPRDNVAELASRICGDLSSLPRGVANLVTGHWPLLFGTRPIALAELGVETGVHQGLPWTTPVLAAVLLIPAAAVGARLARERRWRAEYSFCAYLVLVGALSVLGYIVGRCGHLDQFVMRYELLSVLGAAGLGAWFLRVADGRVVRRLWIGAVLVAVAVAAQAHGRLLTEYLRQPPVSGKVLILRHLEARGIRYAEADYWLAYALTFLSREEIIVASNDFLRIPEHNRIVGAHRSEAVRVSRQPCPGGRLLVPRIYLCDP